MSDTDQITILLVDDIAETRENIKKLLSFESDFKVVGTAGTGLEAIKEAEEHRPDIIIMDINMPDMDGLEATRRITQSVTKTGVIIMSVQDDVDYFRRAMSAGARDFLSKPVNMDELYNAIRKVNDLMVPIRVAAASQGLSPAQAMEAAERQARGGQREGNIIMVYSPQGGAGTTTIAANLAIKLMSEDVKVLLVDADLYFGDVDTLLKLQAQTTLVELIGEDIDEIDIEHFDNMTITHDSGLKVLLGPARPEMASEVVLNSTVPADVLDLVRGNYDYIVIDTGHGLDDVTLALMNIATRIVLVTTTSLTAIKNARFVLDIFEKLEYPPDKTVLVLNKVWDERQRKNATLPVDRIESFLKRSPAVQIPQVDERLILTAILKGVPVTIFERDQSKPPVKQLSDLAEFIDKDLHGGDEDLLDDDSEAAKKKRGGLGLRLGR